MWQQPKTRIEPSEMITGKVSNDAGAQEPGTEIYAAQATINLPQ